MEHFALLSPLLGVLKMTLYKHLILYPGFVVSHSFTDIILHYPCLNDQLHPIHTTRSFVYGRGKLEKLPCVFIQSVQIRILRCTRNGIIPGPADSSESSRN